MFSQRNNPYCDLLSNVKLIIKQRSEELNLKANHNSHNNPLKSFIISSNGIAAIFFVTGKHSLPG